MGGCPKSSPNRSDAQELGKPIAFDSVGVGATPYRTATTHKLIKTVHPTVIRGNASEICALVVEDAITKGVDRTQQAESALFAAKELSKSYKCAVVISGTKDFIVKAGRVIKIENGHPLMAKVTGIGCTSTALIGAFLTVNVESLVAAVHAMAVMGITGELAVEKASRARSLQIQFLDALSNLEKADIELASSQPELSPEPVAWSGSAQKRGFSPLAPNPLFPPTPVGFPPL